MRRAGWIRVVLETLEGSRPLPEAWWDRPVVHVLWGLWWAALFVVVLMTGGQGVKFIYIDF